MKKLKVLVSAYACEPDKGSEPGVGWHWAKQIARFHEVWVITRTNNKESIESELKKNPDPHLHFLYVDLPKWIRFWKKGARGIRVYYYLWQFAALKTAFGTHRKILFDLSHHVTFVNNWQPSMLSLLPLPFIWGPIGSNPPIPKAFLKNIKIKLLSKIRLVVKNLFRYFDPSFYITLLKAKKIIMINNQMINKYPFSIVSKDRFVIEKAIGINMDGVVDSVHSNDIKPRNYIKVISVGQLIYIKGFHLAIEGFAKAVRDNPDLELTIIGNGNEKNNLIDLVKKYAISEKVKFYGGVCREEVFKALAESDIFLFPSFEGGGMVVLEAMAVGLPVVCLDFGRSGEMITDYCGIKVKPITPEQTVKDLSDALLKLAKNSELRENMGEAGRKWVEEVYSWDKKGEMIKDLYAKFI